MIILYPACFRLLCACYRLNGCPHGIASTHASVLLLPRHRRQPGTVVEDHIRLCHDPGVWSPNGNTVPFLSLWYDVTGRPLGLTPNGYEQYATDCACGAKGLRMFARKPVNGSCTLGVVCILFSLPPPVPTPNGPTVWSHGCSPPPTLNTTMD